MSDTTTLYPIFDPIAFCGALLAAPLVVALMFFWILLIPVFAVPYGILPYLVFGMPVFLFSVTRRPIEPGAFACLALLAHAAFVLCLSVWTELQPQAQAEPILFFALFGLPHAAAWGAAFAALYRRFYRPLLH